MHVNSSISWLYGKIIENATILYITVNGFESERKRERERERGGGGGGVILE